MATPLRVRSTRPLTVARIDGILSAPLPTNSERLIWTANAIAKRLGCSADFVRDRLAKAEDSPVRRVGGRYVALESELLAFFSGTLGDVWHPDGERLNGISQP